MRERLEEAQRVVADALGAINPGDVERACEMIAAANAIGIYGCGREGLQMRGFAMRLFHLGLDVACLGDVTMPPLRTGDLLVVSAGPGELATVTAHMTTARAAGARILFITAEPDTPTARNADLALIVPAQTMASEASTDPRNILPMGSVYEGALFFLFELMVAEIRDRLGETADSMRARHTNME